jgi:TPR repeat protein
MNSLDPTGQQGRDREVFDKAVRGNYVEPKSLSEVANKMYGEIYRENYTLKSPPLQPTNWGGDFVSRVVGLLTILTVVALFWGWLTIGREVKNFFNRHYTDPATATGLGKDDFAHGNYTEARFWFDVGATHGIFEAQFDLGLMYARGIGGPANRAEAMTWITKAAVGGYRPAREWLAKNGTKKDKSY